MRYNDSIAGLAKNAVFGPYLDGGNHVLAKMLDIKILPDSVKCRHILLGTKNPQTGQPIMDDSTAHRLADSIALAIRNGSNFDTLETKFSTDVAAHRDKGVMTFSSVDIQGDNFAKEFGQFILFDGKPGDKKVVKTYFGWHYIEILNFINPEPHYKVAYMAKTMRHPAPKPTTMRTTPQPNLPGTAATLNHSKLTMRKILNPKESINCLLIILTRMPIILKEYRELPASL